MSENTVPVFMHIDMDAFFASVEQHDHPEYRGKPVIVGGLPGDRRAVVSTASYEARRFGVHSAMPLFKAVSLCPNAVFVRGNMKRYSEVSQTIMDIFADYSPTVIQMSIDEAFIDATGTKRLFGPPQVLAAKIKERVMQATGLTVSIGIASTMYVAKIASGFRKPNGLTLIPFGDEEKFMTSLPLEKVWGAGTKTIAHIKNAGIRTTAQLRDKSLASLTTIFGNCTGTFLYNAMRGNKEMKFGDDPQNRSLSAESTYEFDLTDRYTIETALMQLAQTVIWRMHRAGVRSKTVSLKIRYEDFTTVSVQETSDSPVANADDLYERCRRLLQKKYQDGRGIRLLGIACEKVESKDLPSQGELFNSRNEKLSIVEKAIFEMESKNPALKLRKARLIEAEQNTLSHHGRNG